MAGKYGVDNIIKVFNLLLEMGNVGDFIGAHPELGAARWSKITDLFDEAMLMTTFSFSEMKKEFAELDPEDRQKVMTALKKKFDLENDALELKIEDGLDLAVQLYELINKIISFSKSSVELPVPEPKAAPKV